MSLNTELMGINAAQNSIDTIGNNIANMNTEGFKGSTMEFADLIGTSLEGTSGNTLTPGQGVVASNLSQLCTEGTITQTGNPLDLAINGQGFFQMQTDRGILYTRAGSFQVDTNGFLVDAAGDKLMGSVTPTSGSSLGAIGPLQISRSALGATATTTLGLNVNLPTTDAAISSGTAFNPSSASTYDESTATTIYDSIGTGYTLTTYFTRVSGSGTPDKWQVHWQLSDPTTGAGTTVSVATLPDGASALNVAYSFTGTSLTAQSFGVNAITNNGNAPGTFTGLQIDSNGQLIGQYSNGLTKTFGTIALANFENPQGLIPMTGTFWQASLNSGPALLGAPNTQGLGTLQSGALEGSNVDRSTQLVSLIVAQQAFQANAQAISYEQQHIQHLLNIQ